MENQMEKKMENEMETGGIYRGLRNLNEVTILGKPYYLVYIYTHYDNLIEVP